MNWVWLLLGIFVGWLIATAIDWLFWRNRRICGEMEASLQASVDRLEQQNSGLTAEIGRNQTNAERVSKLEADLNARTAQYNGLLADVDMRKKREAALAQTLEAREAETKAARALRTRTQEMESQLSERDAALAQLRTTYEGRGAQLSGLTAKVSDLESELTKRDVIISQLSAELNAAQATPPATVPTAAVRAQTPVAQPITEAPTPPTASIADRSHATAKPEVEANSDLGMIWGVNDEVNGQLHASGIYTYQQLASSRASDVDSALSAASRYYPGMDKQAIHGSWIKQSDFAMAGRWDDLSNYQHESIDLASSRDDLKVIWGIGPKIEGVMNENGIYTFAQVASVPAERLTEILHKAGPRFRISSEKLHETWPEQARLASRGEMDALSALQSTLSNRNA